MLSRFVWFSRFRHRRAGSGCASPFDLAAATLGGLRRGQPVFMTPGSTPTGEDGRTGHF